MRKIFTFIKIAGSWFYCHANQCDILELKMFRRMSHFLDIVSEGKNIVKLQEVDPVVSQYTFGILRQSDEGVTYLCRGVNFEGTVFFRDSIKSLFGDKYPEVLHLNILPADL